MSMSLPFTSLAGAKMVLGVTGSIAAYKALILLRLLQTEGALVRVVMTASATQFVGAQSFQALSGAPVLTSFEDESEADGMGHIAWAEWADLVLVAPASASFLSRAAQASSSDILSALYLATRAPVWMAPAMNVNMWTHPATQAQVAQLKSHGVRFLGPDSGEQACGMVGEGRLMEPDAIVESLHKSLKKPVLLGKHVVITAGPTREPIDPVRFISNHSSGKMGYAMAEAARDLGAQVTLISGPVALSNPAGIRMIQVNTAEAMLIASQEALPADVFVSVAAVSDYRLASGPSSQKNSKEVAPTFVFESTPDVVHSIAQHQKRPACVVAFVAETEHLMDRAKQKLRKKGVDFVVANDVSVAGIGFAADEHEATLLSASCSQFFPRQKKYDLALKLWMAMEGKW